MLPELRETFYEELLALIGAFESKLLAMEEAVQEERSCKVSGDASGELFRIAHNIKSAAAMLGLAQATAHAHALESVLEQARQGTAVLDARTITQLLFTLDMLRAGLSQPEPPPAAAAGSAPARPSVKRQVRIALRLDAGALRRGLDPLALLRALAELGQVTGSLTDDRALPGLDGLNPEQLYLRFELTLLTQATEQELRAPLRFGVADDELDITWLDRPEPASAPPASNISLRDAGSALRDAGGQETSLKTLMVSVSRVDALVELAAELSIATSRLEQLRSPARAGSSVDTRLQAACDELRQLASRMQEATMAIRLVPVGPTFALLRRYVRDQGALLGKEVDLLLAGAHTELDKSIAERLFDPLKHLVRNAIDHGIETAAERQRLGKPERGVLRLEARQEHGRVMISVHDDGRGLDRERIRTVAIARGLIPAEAELSDADVYGVIFRPGFSTRTEVGELSGRGIGLDVVRQNVFELGGDLRVGSRAGAGTVFTLSLPLTLAMIEGVVLRCGEHRLVVPLELVLAVVRPRPEQLIRIPGGSESLRLHDGQAALLRLGPYLGFEEPRQDTPTVGVVVASPAGRLVLGADEILAQESVLLKGFHPSLRIGSGVLAAAMMAAGGVALVLDIAALAEAIAPSTSSAAAASSDIASQLVRPKWRY